MNRPQPRRPDQFPGRYDLDNQDLYPTAVVAPGASAHSNRVHLFVDNNLTPPQGGIFFYSPAGNLIGYWIATAGTDPIDHTPVPFALAGITLTDRTVPKIYANLSEQGLTIENISSATNPSILVQDDAGTSPFRFVTIDPAGGVSMDAWNQVGGGGGLPAFGSGWSNVAGNHLAYRMMADLTVMISGGVHHTNVAAATIFTLPSGWIPAREQHFAVVDGTGTTTLIVDTSGNVTVTPAPSAAADMWISVRVAFSSP